MGPGFSTGMLPVFYRGAAGVPQVPDFIGRSGEIRTPDPHNPIVVRLRP